MWEFKKKILDGKVPLHKKHSANISVFLTPSLYQLTSSRDNKIENKNLVIFLAKRKRLAKQLFPEWFSCEGAIQAIGKG